MVEYLPVVVVVLFGVKLVEETGRYGPLPEVELDHELEGFITGAGAIGVNALMMVLGLDVAPIGVDDPDALLVVLEGYRAGDDGRGVVENVFDVEKVEVRLPEEGTALVEITFVDVVKF